MERRSREQAFLRGKERAMMDGVGLEDGYSRTDRDPRRKRKRESVGQASSGCTGN